MKALVLIAEGFEDLELFCPWFRLREEGVEVTVASPGGKPVSGRHGYRIESDMPIREANPSEYDLLLLPGGSAPELLRLREEAVDVARTFADEGLRIAALGHAPQLLLSAGALGGRTLTCAAGIRDDVRAAGATYRDEAVVVDGNLLTGRGSDDLPEFNAQLVLFLSVQA
ncbi:MAG: type 1 glutamine amidotransferase domain-containing protein [Gemmataceae bacterium]